MTAVAIASLVLLVGYFSMSANASETTQGGNGLDPFFRFDSLFRKYGTRYGVPWRWLKAICMNESSLGQNRRVAAGAVSEDGKSWGLMQFTLPTARDFLGTVWTDQQVIAMLNDPETSVRLAAQFIRSLITQFNGERRRVIMSYNQGAGNTRAGKEYAAEYYNRFTRNLAVVMERQPGGEMETG